MPDMSACVSRCTTDKEEWQKDALHLSNVQHSTRVVSSTSASACVTAAVTAYKPALADAHADPDVLDTSMPLLVSCTLLYMRSAARLHVQYLRYLLIIMFFQSQANGSKH